VAGVRLRSRAPLGAGTIAVLALFTLVPSCPVYGQPVTTATVTGTVRSPAGGEVTLASVRVINQATGYAVETQVVHGRYRVAGLEIGGPYIVRVRRIGYAAQERTGLLLSLNQQLEVDFVLEPAPRTLDTVHVVMQGGHTASSHSSDGTATMISDSTFRQMPALNRDVLDFVRLVPQVGTRFGGISGSGVGFRFNNYLIDGVSERLLNGNGAGGKAISIDAVKEYQVLLAPYDVRYGDFAGALVNAVTKSGTNDVHGTAFLYSRNQRLARSTEYVREAPYGDSQFGFTIGGPIIRDRAHYFIAGEVQRMQQAATGPYIGQRADSPNILPVADSDVTRFADLLRGYGLEAGTGGPVTRRTPNANLFIRTDVALPAWRSRAVIRHNYAQSEQAFFSRNSTSGSFPLSSNAWSNAQARSSSALQLLTQLPQGALNQLLVAYSWTPSGASQFTRSSRIQVGVPGVGAASNPVLVAGPPDVGQGTGSRMRTIELANDLTGRAGAGHTLSLGLRTELFWFNNTSTRSQFGLWTFSNLDSLQRGSAASFRVEKDFGSATKRLSGAQTSAYLGDDWAVNSDLSLSAGLRADLLAFGPRPTYDPIVDSIFGRRTDDFPTSRLHWSPRLGFNWKMDQERDTRLRGGVGVFAGRPPLAWISASERFDGIGTRTLSCPLGNAPQFVASVSSLPVTCRNGSGAAVGPVNLIDPTLTMPKMFRASLAHDRELPWGLKTSIEALYTRTLSDFIFQNASLAGPQATDRHGRVLYGIIDTLGREAPTPVAKGFQEVIDLQRHGNGHSFALTGHVEKQFSSFFQAAASYTKSRVRDVQSITTNSPALTFAFWSGGRTVAGRHDDLSTGVSSYEIAHRVVLSGAWTAPWTRWATGVSLYYIGESGMPFTFTDSTAVGDPTKPNGDLNADGSNANDPIYVPRNAADTAEIVFRDMPANPAARQQAALESVIQRTPCLRRQRGRILARNSCVGPWVHTSSAALRQSLPTFAGHQATMELEIFNLLNLIRRDWGLFRVPTTFLLQQVGQMPGAATTSQPVFVFDPSWRPYGTENAESAYQIQLALRYRF
jgi:hypothetical protein